jgi:hypothetical protein
MANGDGRVMARASTSAAHGGATRPPPRGPGPICTYPSALLSHPISFADRNSFDQKQTCTAPLQLPPKPQAGKPPTTFLFHIHTAPGFLTPPPSQVPPAHSRPYPPRWPPASPSPSPSPRPRRLLPRSPPSPRPASPSAEASRRRGTLSAPSLDPVAQPSCARPRAARTPPSKVCLCQPRLLSCCYASIRVSI